MPQRGKPKGLGKSGGRTTGTPNKRSLELLRGMLTYECIPAEQIALLLLSQELQAREKMECWEKLLPYLYPQQKAIDPDGYLSLEQAAGLLGAQAQKFRMILETHIPDAALVAAILEGLRASKQQSPVEGAKTL